MTIDWQCPQCEATAQAYFSVSDDWMPPLDLSEVCWRYHRKSCGSTHQTRGGPLFHCQKERGHTGPHHETQADDCFASWGEPWVRDDRPMIAWGA